METVKFHLKGHNALIMHSDRAVNALDPLVKAHKELTSQRKKTDEVLVAIMESEFRLSMYYDEKVGPYVPHTNIVATIKEGAKLSKLGKAVERAIFDEDTMVPLQFKGPRDIKEIWASETADGQKKFADVRTAVVGQSRVMRCRPKFAPWHLTCELTYNPEALNRAELVRCVEAAGQFIGLCDYRPRFGRFTAEVVK